MVRMVKSIAQSLPYKWDIRMLEMARHVSTWSKDPSTQAGSVICDDNRRILGVGYNGFPRGIDDDERLEEKHTKYPLVIHAEMNAILNSTSDLKGSILYIWPLPPCDRCAVHIIQAGIKAVVTKAPSKEHEERWGEAMQRARDAFEEAGVFLLEIPYDK